MRDSFHWWHMHIVGHWTVCSSADDVGQHTVSMRLLPSQRLSGNHMIISRHNVVVAVYSSLSSEPSMAWNSLGTLWNNFLGRYFKPKIRLKENCILFRTRDEYILSCSNYFKTACHSCVNRSKKPPRATCWVSMLHCFNSVKTDYRFKV